MALIRPIPKGEPTVDVYNPITSLTCSEDGIIAYSLWNSRLTVASVTLSKNGTVIAQLPQNSTDRYLSGTVSVTAGDVITSNASTEAAYESCSVTYIH